MARILLTAILFFMTFSHHLMAAEAQLKKAATAPQNQTEECTVAYNECKKLKDTKSLQAGSTQNLQECIKICGNAAKQCESTKQKGNENTPYAVTYHYQRTCEKLLKQSNKQK